MPRYDAIVFFFLTLLACADLGDAERADGLEPTVLVDSGGALSDGPPPPSAAYTTCVTDASCGAGEACTTVSGFATSYCAPACDPDGTRAEQAASCGVLEGVDAVCLDSGRCARECGSPDTCPDDLDCQTAAPVGDVCAGEALGSAGFYGTCTHPMAEGPDCPADSGCFGGSLLGIENGVCLPYCETGECPQVPDGLSGVNPLCFDTTEYGFDHPMCVLLCTPGSAVCPETQECLDYGGFGFCAPAGTSF